MVVRIVLVAGAAALIALGAARTHAHDACRSASSDAFAIGIRRLPQTAAPGVAKRLEDHCRGAEQLVDGVVGFLRAGADEPAAALAADAVRREPERRDAWLAVANVRRAQGDNAGAKRALDRARQLDPLGVGG
jgi:hypothetical protein